jgi:phosphoglycerate dehydrogenase-like enzyme
LDKGVLTRDVILTNAAGVAGIGVSEFVVTMMLALLKKVPMMIDNQRNKRWGSWRSGELHEKTLGILGLGNLGKPIAKSAKLGFDMNVLAYDLFVEEYELNEETVGLINEKALSMMKRSSFLINVARGPIIDREAFLKALKESWIAGACLDVFWGDASQMELSPDDELWDLDNLIISPHNAWYSANYHVRAVDLFVENLNRFIKGEELLNQVKW